LFNSKLIGRKLGFNTPLIWLNRTLYWWRKVTTSGKFSFCL